MCQTLRRATCVFLALVICGDFKFFDFFSSMALDVGPSLVIWKDIFLKVVRVPADLVAPSEVTKMFPPSELLLVCWGYSDPESFHFESVLAVMARVIFVSLVEMCLCTRCGKSD